MMTREELGREFWMLTQGILQDSVVDTEEAMVIKRWLEEHDTQGEFAYLIRKLDKLFADNYIDRFESQEIIAAIGTVLRQFRTGSAS